MKIAKMLSVFLIVIFLFASISIAECPSFTEGISPFDPAEYAIRKMSRKLESEPTSWEKRDNGGYYVSWILEEMIYSIGLNGDNRVDKMAVTTEFSNIQDARGAFLSTAKMLKKGGAKLVKSEEGYQSIEWWIKCGTTMHLLSCIQEENVYYVTLVVAY